jgi:hypothetical protein
VVVTNPDGLSNTLAGALTYAPCSSSLSSMSQSFASAGGAGSVNVSTVAGCNWTATSGASWLTINTGASGSGSGIVAYAVAANPASTARSASIAIGGESYTVNQSAAAIPFTDDPIVAGSTLIRAVHITELRIRIDAIRAAKLLLPVVWSDPLLAGGMSIVAQHIADLRTALAQVYTAAGLPPPTYTDPIIGPGVRVKAVHIAEIRAAITAIQ